MREITLASREDTKVSAAKRSRVQVASYGSAGFIAYIEWLALMFKRALRYLLVNVLIVSTIFCRAQAREYIGIRREVQYGYSNLRFSPRYDAIFVARMPLSFSHNVRKSVILGVTSEIYVSKKRNF